MVPSCWGWYRASPIWFGVIIVMTVELGLITPPVGMNVFVIKSVLPENSFPAISLWLPRTMG